MKGMAKAFALGGSLAAFFYLAVTAGLETGFRLRQTVADRRARREKQERTET